MTSRILALPKYSRSGASSRIRCYQYLPRLEALGLDVEVRPLFRESWTTALAGGRRPSMLAVASWYASRVVTLASAPRYDALWIGDELFSGMPALGERLLSAFGIPYVVEYDDAIFHRYERHASLLTRRLLGAKIEVVMAHAAVVIAGNDYLAERATKAGARRVVVIPSAVDTEAYKAAPAPDRPFTIGWIGSPTTTGYLALIATPLRGALDRGARVVLVGARPGDVVDARVTVQAWAEDTEATDVAAFDVGVAPLADGPWERGKCGFKIIQYMAAGRPVVASAVGANRSIVQHGTTGFLASTDAEWTAALRALEDDPGLRRRMGEAGRRLVEERYSIRANVPALAACLREAAGRRSNSGAAAPA